VIEPIWPMPLGDKLVDWGLLAIVGGESLLVGKRVLNLGPGFALEETVWAARAGRWVSLDSDQSVLARVEWLAPAAERVRSFLPVIPLERESFDVVLDFSTLDNTPDPVQGYREAATMLVPGGLLLSSYANAAAEGAVTTPSDTPLWPDDLAQVLIRCGLDVIYRAREDQTRASIVAQRPTAETIRVRNEAAAGGGGDGAGA
jgi:SAM-dependent methyltransferase